MFAGAEKSCKTTGICEGSQMPFPAELQKFFILSRECQTQFSYTEESSRSRKFQFHERNLIKEFISYTVFLKKCVEETTMLNTDDEGVVKNITERIIQESKKYNCEVHFNVIWVYYFTYRDAEINSLPVFKIHKGRGNGAVYVDSFSKVYQTWNCYIDGPGLGESLMCVPRNGEYSFDGGELNLEFVLTRNIQLESRSDPRLWVKHVTPMFQVLQNWVIELKSWLSNHPEIYTAAKYFLDFVMENDITQKHQEILTIFRIAKAILFAYLQPELKVNCQFAEWCLQAVKIVFRYLNIQENFEVFNRFLIEIEKIIAKNWEHYPEAKEILVLLSRPSKDWIEISESLCCLIKKIRHRK